MTAVSPAVIDTIIAALDRADQGYKAPLFRAVRDQQLTVAEVARGGPIPLDQLRRLQAPAVLLIGDDDGASSGPEGWPDHPAWAEWAGVAMVHGAGGEPGHYLTAVEGALRYGRLIMVETAGSWARPWCDALRAANPTMPMLAIMVQSGQQHPLPHPGGVH